MKKGQLSLEHRAWGAEHGVRSEEHRSTLICRDTDYPKDERYPPLCLFNWIIRPERTYS